MPNDDTENTIRRSDETPEISAETVINVTPNSFSDIFIKPRLAALAANSGGMVLVKKKPAENEDQPSSSTTPVSTATTPGPQFTVVDFTTATPYFSTTTPYVLVQKKNTTTTTVPNFVVDHENRMSFHKEEEPGVQKMLGNAEDSIIKRLTGEDWSVGSKPIIVVGQDK